MNRTQPIDYKSVLSLFLPAGLLDYFDITEASNMGDYFRDARKSVKNNLTI